jgi:hypothetical protein
VTASVIRYILWHSVAFCRRPVCTAFEQYVVIYASSTTKRTSSAEMGRLERTQSGISSDQLLDQLPQAPRQLLDRDILHQTFDVLDHTLNIRHLLIFIFWNWPLSSTQSRSMYSTCSSQRLHFSFFALFMAPFPFGHPTKKQATRVRFRHPQSGPQQ